MDAALGFLTAGLSSSWIGLSDGWSQLFVTLIAAIGTLIVLYAYFYFYDKKTFFKFLIGFLLFTAAMLGVVTADHLILLFIAWELTTLSSYFLILLKAHTHHARKAALQALLVTGMGGLSLLAGIVLLAKVGGSFSLTELFAAQIDLSAINEGGWIAALILFGAVTKSAQVPFHFWLPGAMVAPTPVSAYLHSATMVKAGIYLLFRMMPILGTLPGFFEWVVAIGLITFFWGAIRSVRASDLKEVLAFTTVSNLGLLFACTTLPPQVFTLPYWLLAHAVYKAGLFMMVGILDQGTQTRDRKILSGLRFALPREAFVSGLLALSSLGLPLTLGSIAKTHLFASFPLWLSALLMLGLALSGGATLFVAIRPFIGSKNTATPVLEKPTLRVLVPPLVLGLAGLFLPFAVSFSPVENAAHVWGGALGYGAILISFFILFIEFRRPGVLDRASAPLAIILESQKKSDSGWQWDAAAIWDRSWSSLLEGASRLTKSSQPKQLILLGSIVSLTLLVGLVALIPKVPGVLPTLSFSFLDLTSLGLVALLLFGVRLVLASQNRLVAVLSLGLVGYALAVLFALYSAPDLAITQFVVETLSVLLFVAVLRRLGELRVKTSGKTAERSHALLLAVSILSGWCVAIWVWFAASYPAASQLRGFFAEASLLFGKGRNVVNVILVDFRALDTLGEVSVICIACLGAWILIRGARA